MAKAIGMIELNSIAKGVDVADKMLKSANVELIRASTICPGKYVIIISGDTGDVKTAMAHGELQSEHFLVNKLLIPSIHPQLIPAISMTNQIEKKSAVGVLEYYSVASAIVAADIAAKAANITLIEVRIGFAIGGKGFVTLCGDVGDVDAAVKAATAQTELLVNAVVIPRADPKLFETLL